MLGIKHAALTLIVTTAFTAQAGAQPVPPLLANFPVAQDDDTHQAFAERVRASFPRDIRSSTLSALLEMDGFAVEATDEGYAATFMQADFPCITDYLLTWQDSETGRVDAFNLETNQKCI